MTDRAENKLRLSVVIPSLNSVSTIGIQLEALSRQEWNGSWEVIVADNGSTDGTQDIVRSCADRLPDLKLVDASDSRGAAHARNAGVKAARGEAIVFCDSDDEAAPGWLAAMGNALAHHDFVVNRMTHAGINPPWLAETFIHPQETGVQRVAYPPYLPHAGGSGIGIRRHIHELVEGFDESLPCLEDTDYCFRVQLAGFPLRFVTDAVMHYRLRERPEAAFRQACLWAEYNVLLYKRYRRSMRLDRPWWRHLSSWRSLLRSAPRALQRKETRMRWIRALGWQIGLLKGAILHRAHPVR
jgi:glycosyltransferase involved in cell wall biosynthesis